MHGKCYKPNAAVIVGIEDDLPLLIMNELECAHAPIHTHIPNISLPKVTKQKKQGRKEQVQITLTKTDLIPILNVISTAGRQP